jgi:hypothetical protein
MEAGGFEPPSDCFCKSFIDKKIRVKCFQHNELTLSQDLSHFIRSYQDFAPEILPYYSREQRRSKESISHVFFSFLRVAETLLILVSPYDSGYQRKHPLSTEEDL